MSFTETRDPPHDDVTQPLRCSFCGRAQSEVRGLVAGPTPDIAICDACVDLCAEIFKEQGLR